MTFTYDNIRPIYLVFRKILKKLWVLFNFVFFLYEKT